MNDVSERREVRAHEAELREVRQSVIKRVLLLAAAFGTSNALLYISVGEYSLWPVVVWGACSTAFGFAMLFQAFEFMANWPPREIVEIATIEAVIDEQAERLVIQTGPNSLGLSRTGLEPTQWQALATALKESGGNWSREVLQSTGNWGNLTVGKAYPKLVREWEGLGALEGKWREDGSLVSARLTPLGWQEIKKLGSPPPRASFGE